MRNLNVASVAILLFCLAPAVWAASLAETLEAGAIGAEIGKGSASSGLSARDRALATIGATLPTPEPPRTMGDQVINPHLPDDHPSSFPHLKGAIDPNFKYDMGDAENLLRTTKLFKSKDEIVKWFGERPKFVYDTGEKADPMLIPWLAEEYKAGLLQAQAERLWKTGGEQNWTIALHLYEKITRDFSETAVAEKVLPDLDRFTDQYKKLYAAPDKKVENGVLVAIQKMPFPQDVKEKFSAICTSKSRGSTVIIKGQIYRVGQEVGGDSMHPVTLIAVERVPNSRERYGVFLFESEKYYYRPFAADGDGDDNKVPGKINPDEKP